MKNIKQLLKLVGVLTITTGTIISVVACNGNALVNINTVLKTKELGTIAVINPLLPTLDEIKAVIVKNNSNLNPKGITVISAVATDKPVTSATVKPDGIIYKGAKITITFTLVKSDVGVVNEIKTTLETGVKGDSLSISQTQKDADQLIKDQIKTVIDDQTDKTNLATFTFINGDKKLIVGENRIKINVTYKTVKTEVINVRLLGVKKP